MNEIIKKCVDRFLMWRLPDRFSPDGGIEFTPHALGPSYHWPIGTNLFDAEQAKAMFEHCLEGVHVSTQAKKLKPVAYGIFQYFPKSGECSLQFPHVYSDYMSAWNAKVNEFENSSNCIVHDLFVCQPPQQLNFSILREANKARDIEWGAGQKFSLSYRGNELAGEVGEACNVLKKLDRERMGLVGSRSDLIKAAEELADVIICADLAAMDLGIDLAAAVARKFNLTSDKNGLKTKLPEAVD